MNNEKYRNLTLWLIAAWFVFALSASALHLFQTSPTAPPLPFGLAVLTTCPCFSGMVQDFAGVPCVCLVVGPRHTDHGPELENRWIRFPCPLRLWSSAGRVRIAGRMGRYCDWTDGASRFPETHQPFSPYGVYRLADIGSS